MDALKRGELHVTVLNTGSVPRAVNECGFVPVSVKANTNGEWQIRMKLIVPSESPIHEVKDLRNRSLTFTTPSSFSGFKLAVAVLQNEFGLRLGRDYECRFSTSHDESMLRIAAGDQESAVVASDLLQAAYASGRIQRDEIREVYQSAPFPAAAFGYGSRLDPQLADKVRAFPLDGNLADTPISADGEECRLVATNYLAEWQSVRDVDAAIALDDPMPLKRQRSAERRSAADAPDSTDRPESTTAAATRSSADDGSSILHQHKGLLERPAGRWLAARSIPCCSHPAGPKCW